ncbi:hypothetical protein DOTSEDRAFT_80583 [Dothistroma septosporum NZE10]|uniref:Zn(2)-C6 fungal-type domain-containing protein n=1 Tax=Dothistroma septosporum (strain NZE10 / CBS 128990) TaxID=675120 RepID=M2YM13_DOTSN|nr:hypothetical protein DOTSEDRAFT_80583 [Dothistroma septosporum NZE10]
MTDSQRSPDRDNASGTLLSVVESSKRQNITTACDHCRAKKSKCDGQRPCSRCKRHGVDCIYPRGQHETVQQASKRKHDEISESHEQMTQLIHDLAHSDDGQSAVSIARAIGRPGPQDDVAVMHQRWLQRNFISMILQSTAPLSEVVTFATSTFISRGTRIVIPNLEQCKPLRDRIITIEALSGVLADANRPAISPDGFDTPVREHRGSDGMYCGPKFWMRASPWTEVTNNDDLVSDLISWYLAFVSPFWRALEEDLFIAAMRSGDLESEYCSPCLVNAILAHASLFSSHEEVFVQPGQYITRGEHFHKEALKLWALEEGRASLVNLSAVLVLICDCGVRGKPALTLSLNETAAQMNITLEMTLRPSTNQVGAMKYARARAVLWWQVNCMKVNLALAIHPQNSEHGLRIDWKQAPALSEHLQHTTYYWAGYRDAAPGGFDFNTLQVHRAELYRIKYDVAQVMDPGKMGLFEDEIWDRANAISLRLSAWWEGLTPGTRYHKDMPVPQYELHAAYNIASALFGTTTSNTIEDTELSETLKRRRDILYAKVLHYSYRGVTITRDYRETYGLRDTPMCLMLYTWLGAFCFLNDMARKTTLPAPDFVDEIPTKGWTAATSFEECFRCLAGMAAQLLIARGVARTIAPTAQMLDVQLPAAVLQIMHAIVETAWQSVELKNIKSLYTSQWDGASDRARDDVMVEALLASWASDRASAKRQRKAILAQGVTATLKIDGARYAPVVLKIHRGKQANPESQWPRPLACSTHPLALSTQHSVSMAYTAKSGYGRFRRATASQWP